MLSFKKIIIKVILAVCNFVKPFPTKINFSFSPSYEKNILQIFTRTFWEYKYKKWVILFIIFFKSVQF